MNTERMYEVLRAPHISEKASLRTESDNQVVFEVRRDADKKEIATAVSKLFKVSVVKVTTSNVKAKRKRFRGFTGTRRGWKKAYVTLGAGEQIDFLDGVSR